MNPPEAGVSPSRGLPRPPVGGGGQGGGGNSPALGGGGEGGGAVNRPNAKGRGGGFMGAGAVGVEPRGRKGCEPSGTVRGRGTSPAEATPTR